MPEKSQDDARLTDDELARFADLVMSSKAPELPEPSAEDQELRELQRMVLRTRRSFGDVQPDRAMEARILSNLTREWQKVNPGEQGRPFWQGWLRGSKMRREDRSSQKQWRAAGFALAAAALALLLVVLPLAFPGGDGLTGGAGDQTGSGLSPVLLVAGLIVLAGAVVLLLRRRR